MAALSAGTALLVAAASATAAQASGDRGPAPGVITTIAGGVGGPGPVSNVGMAPCTATYASGSLYVADTDPNSAFTSAPSVIRRINVRTGKLTNIAGDGTDPSTSSVEAPGVPDAADGSPALSAGLTGYCGVAVDAHGNVLLSDATDGIRVVAASSGTFYGRKMTRGDIYTIVSAANPLFGAGWSPGAIEIDGAGNVLFTSRDNHVYALAERSGVLFGQSMQAGQVYSVAGGGTQTGGGVPATSALLNLITPGNGDFAAGLRLDHDGNLVLADSGNELVQVIAGRSGTFYGQSMQAGYIYTIAGSGCCGFPVNGEPATQAKLVGPQGLAIDHAGNVLIMDDGALWAVPPASGRFYGRSMGKGRIYEISGLYYLNGDQWTGVAVDGSGNVVIAGQKGLLVRAGRSGTFYGWRMRAGNLRKISGSDPVNNTTGLERFSGDDGLATEAEMQAFAYQGGSWTSPIEVEASGDVLVADGTEVRLVAAVSGTLFGRRMKKGHIYRVAGNGTWDPRIPRRGTAVAPKIGLGSFLAIGTDAAGNLLIADTHFCRIDVVAAKDETRYGRHLIAGHIYYLAGDGRHANQGDGGPALTASLKYPQGIASDHAGNVLISTKCLIRVLAATSGSHYGQSMTAGDMYTIAGSGKDCDASGIGGPAASATLADPGALVVDRSGNVVVSTSTGILVLAESTGTFYGQPMTAGDIYSVMPVNPGGFTLDRSGNVILANGPLGTVSVVAESTGTFYGQHMTAGDTYQIAGNGYSGETGDGGPATKASLLEPVGVAVSRSGNVFIDDSTQIREITW